MKRDILYTNNKVLKICFFLLRIIYYILYKIKFTVFQINFLKTKCTFTITRDNGVTIYKTIKRNKKKC